MKDKHQKHVNLRRPDRVGEFGRLEWAIIGAPCDTIKKLAMALTSQLAASCQVAYVDADHKEDQNHYDLHDNIISEGAALHYTDKITHARFDYGHPPNGYQRRTLMNACDIVLVNGNHFPATRQIVVIDPKKEQSLHKKLDRLTQVDIILLTESGQEIYPFLQAHLGGQVQHIPILQISDTQSIASELQKKWRQMTPPIYGLVLAGGKSQRMGEDKGAMVYHRKTQREHVADLLQPHCEKVFVSCRPDQAAQIESEQPYPTLPDTFLGLGPLGAILTAFRHNPDAAWFVVACDLPLLNSDALQQLIRARDAVKIATAFRQPDEEGWPEPLITIWEPKSYLLALQFLAQGYSCPRKILINCDIRLIDCSLPEALKNVNTQEEKGEIMDLLGAE
ncbi:MAG: NTP transferase domain-containing protein [Saprospiraceae bacterium]|nr:NTP transferase domain-containing protein [Saprospiraceae bacterium]